MAPARGGASVAAARGFGVNTAASRVDSRPRPTPIVSVARMLANTQPYGVERTPPNAPAPAVAGLLSALTVFAAPPPPGAQLSSPVAIHQKNPEAKAPNVPGMKNQSPSAPSATRTAASTPTPRAIPQKSGRAAISGVPHITTSAATAPKTLAIATLPAAVLSPPAAKYIAHDTNA